MGSLLPAGPHATHAASVAAKRSLQIVASFDAGCGVLGAAPFGADLAVLCWGPASGGDGGEAASGSPARGAVLDASSTADELPVSSPAGGRPAPAAASEGGAPADGPPGSAGQPTQQAERQAGPAAAAAAAGDSQSPAAAQQQQDQQQQQRQQDQQRQRLGLCFFTRAGQLLAADDLSMACTAAQRRWHQLALLYPGDADLQLAAAAAAGAGHSSSSGGGSRLATPRQGSAAGSAAGSGRSTPVKPAPATPPGAASSPASTAGGGEQQQPADGEQQQAGEDGGGASQEPRRPAQAYKWWRDGEEPLYLVSGPEVRPVLLLSVSTLWCSAVLRVYQLQRCSY